MDRDNGDFSLRLDTLDHAISDREPANAATRYVAP